MQRLYEVMFIVRPDVTEEDTNKLVSTLENSVAASGGTVRKVEPMGKRRLAYVVRGFQEGSYILLMVEGAGATIAELERRLRVSEPVIKFLTVRVDEEQKRLEKVKRLREEASRRKPKPAEAEAGASSEPAAASY